MDTIASAVAEESERRVRYDHEFRNSMSPVAVKAAALVRDLRRAEIATPYQRETQAEADEVTPDRDQGTTLALRDILVRLPKGCLLHAHFDALIDFTWLYDVAIATPGICIRSDRPLSRPDMLLDCSIELIYSSSTENATSLYHERYQPGRPVPLSDAAASFPYGGLSAFRNWILSRCTIHHKQCRDPDNGAHIWQTFRRIFPVFRGVIYYEPIFRASIQYLCKQLVGDGIFWAEVRIAFYAPYQHAGGVGVGTQLELLQALQEEVSRFQTLTNHDFWGIRCIFAGSRHLTKTQIVDGMKLCISLKKAFPEMISGYDLVGHESTGPPLSDFLPELLWFRQSCDEEMLDIPFYFHAGECLGNESHAEGNLSDAIMLSSRRLGHALPLVHHPRLLSLVRENGICIESCPISNVVLGFVPSVPHHPLLAMIAHGVPVAIGNDDPAIFGYTESGLTHEFWEILMAFDTLGLEGLGSLARNSVEFASFPSGQGHIDYHEVRLKQWNDKWEEFCIWIVKNLGSSAGSSADDGNDDPTTSRLR